MGVMFITEKDGPVEGELKAKLGTLFDQVTGIKSAYLAVARYDEEPEQNVLLGVRLVSEGEDIALVDKIQEIFRPMFSSSQYLDILFLDGAQERRLQNVCRPFYESAPRLNS